MAMRRADWVQQMLLRYVKDEVSAGMEVAGLHQAISKPHHHWQCTLVLQHHCKHPMVSVE